MADLADKVRHLTIATSSRTLATIATSLLLLCGGAAADPQFEKASIYLEQNATDEDIEVVFVATVNTSGFSLLRVIAPNGRAVLDYKLPDSTIGARTINLESSELLFSDGKIQADFPEGVYRFEGILVSGEPIKAEATLSHTLPEAPTLTSLPTARSDKTAKGVKVRWTAVKDAVAYEVVLMEDGNKRDDRRKLRMNLPEGSTSSRIPEGLLVVGAEYKLAVGALLENGNRTFVEVPFSAEKLSSRRSLSDSEVTPKRRRKGPPGT